MTDEEFAAIKARWRWNLVDALPTGSQAKMDVRALYDEVKRLREIALAVAESHSVAIGSQAALVSRKHNLEQLRHQARSALGLTD